MPDIQVFEPMDRNHGLGTHKQEQEQSQEAGSLEQESRNQQVGHGATLYLLHLNGEPRPAKELQTPLSC